MLSVEYLTENFEEAKEKLARRNFNLSEEIVNLNVKRKGLAEQITNQREVYNQISKSIGEARKNGELGGHEISNLQDEAREKRENIKRDEKTFKELQEDLRTVMLGIPNIPADRVPDGKGSEDNPVLKTWGEKSKFDFDLKDHVEIGARLGILDFERASKASGPRFTILKGPGSILQRSLVSFMLDLHKQKGYEEVSVPYLVSRETMTGTGQLPKFEFDLFKTEVGGRELFLIPTAEVPVTNLHAGEILQESQLPLKYCCYSECFRAEAGSAGRDTKGMLRQHQFSKVELVHFTKPEDSWNELEKLTINAEEVLQKLGLHYQVVSLCTADLGFSARFTYDLEVWLPGQQNYREISSCSNCEDFQARRMNTKFRREETKKTEFIHTLNGSGLAVGRTIIAILEQNQRENGSVIIPEALQPYTNFSVIHPGGKTS